MLFYTATVTADAQIDKEDPLQIAYMLKMMTSDLFGNFSHVFTYGVALSIPTQLLYSHLSPFVYLLVLKKFQEHHIKVLMSIWNSLFSKAVDDTAELEPR